MLAGRPRFYTDCHIGWAVILGLRRRGIDVQSCMESGLLAAIDEEHLQHATANDRVLVSRDRDFQVLHRQNQSHAGIVILTGGTDTGTIIDAIILVHDVMSAEEMLGRIEYVK